MPSGSRLRVMLACALLAAPLACAPRNQSGPIAIAVDPGRFGSVEAAAQAENQVNWWDGAQADDAACTESFAALELRRHLALALGRSESEIRFVRPDQLPDRGYVLVVGSRRSRPVAAASAAASPIVRSDAAPDRDARPSPESFRIHTRRDGKRTLISIEGAGREGTLYGVYRYLEHVGVRFFGLGERGTVLPARPMALPDRLEDQEAPAYRTRGFWSWGARGNDEFFLWMARNRMNLWSAEEPRAAFLKKLGIELSCGGHDLQARFLGRRYFASHPEWYGLHGGRRSDRIVGESGDNYCTSNPEATATLARNLVEALSRGAWRHADRVNVWMMDGGRWCECERCALQGRPTDRVLAVARRVAAEIAAARRDGRLERPVAVSTLAYLETLAPPEASPSDSGAVDVTFFPYFRCYAHALADPSCTEMNARLWRAWQGWSAARLPGLGRLGVGEYYNVSWVKSLPCVYTRILAADIPWYRRNGARDFHYMHAPTRAWGTWTLNHVLLARLLWNTEAPVDSLLDDFFSRYYPRAGTEARAFHDALERATMNMTALKHCAGAFGTSGAPGGRLTVRTFPVFPFRHLQYGPSPGGANAAPSLTEILTSLAEARLHLDRAIAASRDTLEKARLGEDARRFDYGEATIQLYAHLIRLALHDRESDAEGARRELLAAEVEARRLEAVRDLVQVAAEHANARDGLEAAQVSATLEFFRAKYGGVPRDSS